MFEDRCLILIEYDTCNLKNYRCSSTTYDEESGKFLPIEDCTQSAFEAEFWSQMREEPVLKLYPEWKSLYDLLEKYHMHSNTKPLPEVIEHDCEKRTF
jgi:hypothetical protein